ncbi:MAG: glycosyltransferase [Minisyncoccota bacterium]
MKLVIATPLYPPEIGGPATYAKLLEEGLPREGVEVELVKFSDVRHLPKVVRHIVYFWRVFRVARVADVVLAFDTWSTGVPALLAAKARGKKSLVRIGGDILWETYIQRTRVPIRLSEFYTSTKTFSFKEHLIFMGTRWITRHADALVFNTAWQKTLWGNVYGFDRGKASVIENEYPTEREISPAKGRVFVSAGRPHFLKNFRTLEAAFADLKRTSPDIELDTRTLPPSEHRARIRDSYLVVISSVSEISSNTAIDAIRYGKPFIMPYDNGARERLAGAGISIDTLDADALRRAMGTLLDAGEYARASERVRTFTFSHSPEEVVKEFIVILEKVCAS